MLLGIDIGTTNSKAGLFRTDGTAVAVASRATVSHRHPDGFDHYDPEEMWSNIASAIREVLERGGMPDVEAVGITSMAESGLLLDRETGEARSPFMPWYDTCTQPQADRIAREADALERFRRTGLTSSYKLGLAKILWIRDRMPQALENSVWLSASGYIAYRLSGGMAFDYSLAARTFAFRIDRKEWEADWLGTFGLNTDLFPQALPSGSIAGKTHAAAAQQTGLAAGVPVAVSGHDHVCAALAVGAVTPGIVFDSMGTAETLVGTLDEKPLGRREFESGLNYGCHVAPGKLFWMGGNSASGGSVEWLRSLLADEKLGYDELLQLLHEVPAAPTGILYYPYLSGSGAPIRDSRAKASFIGLTREHGKADLIKAVLEGTCYQLQAIRLEAEAVSGNSINRLLVVGGGTRNPQWLQTKADVLNCTLEVPRLPEAAALGAALAAGVGAGIYSSVSSAAESVRQEDIPVLHPDSARNRMYRDLYENGYARLQEPLRTFFKA